MEMQGLWEMQPRNVDTAELGVPLHALGILEELAWLLGIPIFHGAEESKVLQLVRSANHAKLLLGIYLRVKIINLLVFGAVCVVVVVVAVDFCFYCLGEGALHYIFLIHPLPFLPPNLGVGSGWFRC